MVVLTTVVAEFLYFFHLWRDSTKLSTSYGCLCDCLRESRSPRLLQVQLQEPTGLSFHRGVHREARRGRCDCCADIERGRDASTRSTFISVGAFSLRKIWIFTAGAFVFSTCDHETNALMGIHMQSSSIITWLVVGGGKKKKKNFSHDAVCPLCSLVSPLFTLFPFPLYHRVCTFK